MRSVLCTVLILLGSAPPVLAEEVLTPRHKDPARVFAIFGIVMLFYIVFRIVHGLFPHTRSGSDISRPLAPLAEDEA